MKESQVSYFLLTSLLLTAMLFAAACSDDDDNNLDERGAALSAQSLSFGQSLTVQLSVALRPPILGKANNIALLELDSQEAYDQLEATMNIESIEETLLEAAIVDANGLVIHSIPEEYVGLDWSSNEIITHVQINQVPSISKVIEGQNEAHTFEYVFPLMEGSNFRGMLWTNCQADSLIKRSIGYRVSTDTSTVDAFILETDTRIIYDHDPDLFGVKLSSSNGISHGELAQAIIDESDSYYLDYEAGGPGARHTSGARIVGWSRITIEDVEWVIALTEAR